MAIRRADVKRRINLEREIQMDQIRALVEEWRTKALTHLGAAGDEAAFGRGLCANELESLLASFEAEPKAGEQ